MDFWQQRDAARNRLLLLYAAGMLGLSLLVAIPLALYWEKLYPGNPLFPVRVGLAMSGILVCLGVCSLFSPIGFGGGKNVAESLNGILIQPQTRDAHELRLRNVVEEMALASGLPVPPIYILEEKGINAFAAGLSPRDAVIGVTRGALKYLNREELQAVMGHEFSHILNGDMRLNLRFAKMIFSLTGLAWVGHQLFRVLSRLSVDRRRKSSPLLGLLTAFAAACYLFGILGGLFSRILQAAVNRQREYQADASAVQFTRSLSLASALKRIGASYPGSRQKNPSAALYSHMFFCCIGYRFLSSHPPLESRIRRLEPNWDGVFPESPPMLSDADMFFEKLHGRLLAQPVSPGLGDSAPDGDGAAARPEPIPNPESWEAELGASVDSASDAERGEAERRLRQACREPLDAVLLVLALLLDKDPGIRERELAMIGRPPWRKTIEDCAGWADLAGEKQFVPLLALAMPALKTLSRPQYLNFRRMLRSFVDADGEFSFREWILCRIVDSQAGAPHGLGGGDGDPLPPIKAAAALLASLARLEPDETKAEAAFAAGWRALGWTKAPMPEKAGWERLDAAVRSLAERAPEKMRRRFLRAARETVMSDWRVTDEEDMFLRMLAVCLGDPDPAAAGQKKLAATA